MCMKHLFESLQSRLLATLILVSGLLTSCDKETQTWENDGRTATITLHVPMAESSVTRTTDEEYQQAETKINTLRILILSPDNRPIVNQKFDSPDITGGYLTIEGVPVGKVMICAIANEAALGKNYDNFEDFENDLVDVENKKKLRIIDEQRTHFPKRFTESEIAQYGLPMSWINREAEIAQPGPTPQTIEVNLERAVAKLNIIMNNALSNPITITSMTFGKFFGDQLYLFREETLDIPAQTAYATQEYTEVSIEIPGGESKTLACYIYPSYAWKSASTATPYTIGFTTTSETYDPVPFINEFGGALNSIARNKQVNIHATLSAEASIRLNFVVKEWDSQNIEVPPFN